MKQSYGRPLVFSDFEISNPKRHMDSVARKDEKLFPYYAGYSAAFAEKLISSAHLRPGALVFDPWNGSGTTTHVARKLGFDSIGMDLNPVMVIVAKASFLTTLDVPSLTPLCKTFLERVEANNRCTSKDDPLLTWLSPKSSAYIRAVECEINHSLVSFDSYKQLKSNTSLETLSPLAAFFYVALFRAVRRLLTDFIPTNPTWTRKPESHRHRKNPLRETVSDFLLSEVATLSERLDSSGNIGVEETTPKVKIEIGNAEAIRLDTGSVDAIISSPPYCTRIDYAVATSIELAVLGLNQSEFDTLRRSLTGTSTVEPMPELPERNWGATCNKFLDNIYRHTSKASKTYYYKSHLQYFRSLSKSMSEISRVLSPYGSCVLVVQDSHYKELLNDVPTIVCEMANLRGLRLVRRDDFSSGRSMAGINKEAKKYLTERKTTESVLCFQLN